MDPGWLRVSVLPSGVSAKTPGSGSASALASARAVSAPRPDEPPVTIARRPDRSTPAMTSAAVDSAPNGVVMRSAMMMSSFRLSS